MDLEGAKYAETYLVVFLLAPHLIQPGQVFGYKKIETHEGSLKLGWFPFRPYKHRIDTEGWLLILELLVAPELRIRPSSEPGSAPTVDGAILLHHFETI